MSLRVELSDIQDTQSLAQYISSIVGIGDVVLLKGNLGSGKTAFARLFIGCFVENAHVASPTFSLVNVYDGKVGEIWHYDLYRVKHQEELYELGLDDALNKAITIIEWPEIIENDISNNGVALSLKCKGNSDLREVTISLLGDLSKKASEVQMFIKGMNDSRR